MISALAVLGLLLGQGLAADLPPFIMTCSKNDPNLSACFERAANDAIPKFKSGVPSLGVPPMDPLEIPRIDIKTPGNGRISLDLAFWDIKFYNVSKCTVKTRIDRNTKKVDGQFLIPHTKMQSDYEATGKILVVPIKGKGKADIDIYGSKADFSFRVVPKDVKGTTYYMLDGLQYQLTSCQGMKMRFTNLLGNRALGESVNEVLNENWEELYQIVRPGFSEGFRQYFSDLGKKVFSKVPADKIFPETV